MTPEQILIDGLEKAPHSTLCQQLWSFKEGSDESYEIQPCDCWKAETLQAYNEAKAQEAASAKNAQVQQFNTPPKSVRALGV